MSRNKPPTGPKGRLDSNLNADLKVGAFTRSQGLSKFPRRTYVEALFEMRCLIGWAV